MKNNTNNDHRCIEGVYLYIKLIKMANVISGIFIK